MTDQLQTLIEAAFETRDAIDAGTRGEIREAVGKALALLDRGEVRVAEKRHGEWIVNQWLKKAVLLVVPPERHERHRRRPGRRRMVGQGAFEIRGLGRGASSAPPASAPCPAAIVAALGLYRAGRRADAVLRQSRRLCRQRHDGRYLGDGRLLRADRQERAIFPAAPASAACWSRCRPGPSIIEDNCFIGARSEVAEGVIVGEGSVLSMGVFLGASTQDRRPRHRRSLHGPGAALFGGRARLAARQAAAVDGDAGPSLYCAVIVKRVDEQTRSKTSINELLRD